MTVREYNEYLKLTNAKETPEQSSVTKINIYTQEDFNNRTKENWNDYSGLCRAPSKEEWEAWRIRNGF